MQGWPVHGLASVVLVVVGATLDVVVDVDVFEVVDVVVWPDAALGTILAAAGVCHLTPQ